MASHFSKVRERAMGCILLAFVYLGYPEHTPPRERADDGAADTTWLGWDESHRP